jgi:hypothetical protein
MRLLNPNLLRWILSLSLLGICNAYAQDPIYSTGSGGGGTSNSILPPDMFTPLPVKLVYFKGIPQDDYVVLDWSTASEYNNSHFEVERSGEGSRFETLQSVDGAGNSRSTLNYQTVDDDPLPGRSYYRLKQVDWNGTISYSRTVSVYYSGRQSMSLYPTMASSIVHISLSAAFLPEAVTLRIVDAAGRVVSIEKINIGEDVSAKDITLAVGTYPAGLYMVQAEGAGGFYLQQRFIVQ